MPILSFRFEQRCAQDHQLTHAQKQTLKMMLSQRNEITHPDLPNPTRGLEGMEVADEILKMREAVGVLVGGVAEEVWSQRTKPEDLAAHKDVDVAVATPGFELKEKFEGGIDWWLKREMRTDIQDNYSSIRNVDVKWFENGYGCILRYMLKIRESLKPGLYIPSPDEVVDMSKIFTESSLMFLQDQGAVDVDYDDETGKALERRIRRKVKTRLPRFIRERFKGQIMSIIYSKDLKMVFGLNSSSMDFRNFLAAEENKR